jgi:predicted amidophosphoribosyltransferase
MLTGGSDSFAAMSLAKTAGVCPYCKEPIHPQAVKCKHCQSDLSATKKSTRAAFTKHLTFRNGFLTGVVFSIVMAVLAYFQFFRE